MKIKGNDILIKQVVNGNEQFLAASNSCDIELNCDMKPVSSPSSGEYMDYKAGRKTWVVRLNYLVDTTGTALLSQKNIGNKYYLRMYVRNNSSIDKLEGYAFLQQAHVTATRGNLLTGSWVFQGTGNL